MIGPRPEIGERTVRRLVTRICGHCGCVITEGELCSYGCDLDGSSHDLPGETILASYERTDVFLGDNLPHEELEKGDSVEDKGDAR